MNPPTIHQDSTKSNFEIISFDRKLRIDKIPSISCNVW